jgi:hypothetical protein
VTVAGYPARRLVVALGLTACLPLERRTLVEERAASATPWEIRPCEGATAIPPAVDELLTRLESPVRDHCEQHRLGDGATALFVRTMNTVAHDDQGSPLPTCHWEIFRVAPEPVRHLGSLSVCRFRVDGSCIVALDDGAPTTPRTCLEPAVGAAPP